MESCEKINPLAAGQGNESTTKDRVLIIRYGEISLKGMNKPWFERILEGRVRKALKGTPGAEDVKLKRTGGLLIADAFSEEAAGEMIRRISKVFGVATVSLAVRLTERALANISDSCTGYMRELLARRGSEAEQATPLTFKVFAKRSDKSYPVKSPDVAAKVGEAVLEALSSLVKVDVKSPEVMLTVHIRPNEVFIFDEKHSAYGGLPLGTNGKGMVLLSGGIDSPVAAWYMAKRGMKVEAVHFHSYPYTSKRAQEKVEELASILASYCGEIRMHVVNLLPAQEAIAAHCPEEYMTLLARRFMMKIAERIADSTGCAMLVTGESLGQVASQTAEALAATDAAVSMPVMRPLIALDKTDIMDTARDIGTYEKSIEPYEDCCTVFLPRHPATRPRKEDVERVESVIPDAEKLIESLIESKELVIISPPNSI